MKATSLLKRIGWLAFALTASLSSNANAALLAYDPFAYGNDPTQGQYALGDEDAGTNGLGGQNPSIGPTAFYNGAWVQSGGVRRSSRRCPHWLIPCSSRASAVSSRRRISLPAVRLDERGGKSQAVWAEGVARVRFTRVS